MGSPTAADAGYRTWDGWLGFGGFVLDDAVENLDVTTEPLRNRNLGIRRVRVADILDHPQNMRRHPSEQVDAFTGAVDERV